jgi:hypothetical protein
MKNTFSARHEIRNSSTFDMYFHSSFCQLSPASLTKSQARSSNQKEQRDPLLRLYTGNKSYTYSLEVSSLAILFHHDSYFHCWWVISPMNYLNKDFNEVPGITLLLASLATALPASTSHNLVPRTKYVVTCSTQGMGGAAPSAIARILVQDYCMLNTEKLLSCDRSMLIDNGCVLSKNRIRCRRPCTEVSRSYQL